MNDPHESPRPGLGIGPGLQNARGEKGLTLRQVEEGTKIRSRYLQALEREDFGVLPLVYVLGSLKTYADFLGLDGAALSCRLKASLTPPAEPDIPAQLAALEGRGNEDDEYEAAPVAAVGFDRLFLGIGAILVSILAVTTLVTALARGDQSPVSQLNDPSTPQTPSGKALSAQVRDEAGPRPAKPDGGGGGKAGADARSGDDNEDRFGKEPAASKNGEGEGEQNEKDDQGASQASSIFGDAEFVPMSPSTVDASAAATAPAPAPPAGAPASPTAAASASARPDEPSAYPAPVEDGAPTPGPPDGGPATAPATAVGGGGGMSPGPGGMGDETPVVANDPGQIFSRANRELDEALDEASLGR